MSSRLISVFVVSTVLLVSLACSVQAQSKGAPQTQNKRKVLTKKKSVALPNQDPTILRYVERLLPYYPKSSFTITEDTTTPTLSGRYRIIEVNRVCENKRLSGGSSIVIDNKTNQLWLGSVASLPDSTQFGNLQSFLEDFLPPAINKNMKLRTKVIWDDSFSKKGALIPFILRVASGYGEFDRPAAVTADGKFFILGINLPYDYDPVIWRRELLKSSKAVICKVK